MEIFTCPQCQSRNVETFGDPRFVEARAACVQDIECYDCGRISAKIFTLTEQRLQADPDADEFECVLCLKVKDNDDGISAGEDTMICTVCAGDDEPTFAKEG